MKRSRLRNKFLNTRNKIDREVYNNQSNYCVSLTRKAKHTFFGNINTTDVTDNKTFWRTVKPFFTDKVKTRSKIALIENRKCKKKKKKKIEKGNYRRSNF